MLFNIRIKINKNRLNKNKYLKLRLNKLYFYYRKSRKKRKQIIKSIFRKQKDKSKKCSMKKTSKI